MPQPSRLSVKYKQDPADVLDYGWNWQGGQKPFLQTGEAITTSTWTVYDTTWTPSDDVAVSSAAHTDTQATVVVSVPVPDTLGVYYVTNHIVTDQGREKDQSFQLTLEEQ